MIHSKAPIFYFISLIFLLVSCGGADPNISASRIVVSMEMANLPAQLEINKTTSSDRTGEYYWVAIFDSNNDGILNPDDVALMLSHAKEPGSSSPRMVSVDSLRADFSILVDSTFRYGIRPLGAAEVSVSGNTITLSVSKSSFPEELANIDQITRVYFRSLAIDDMGMQHNDYLPAEEAYSDIPGDGLFADPAGDVDRDTSLLHADFISAQVTIN